MSSWETVVRAALNEKPLMSVQPEDQREVWRAVLDKDLVAPAYIPFVRLYLATWDGTGQVERGLGQDAAIMSQHVGNRTTSPGLDADAASLYSGLLELAAEGPQKEAHMQADGLPCLCAGRH